MDNTACNSVFRWPELLGREAEVALIKQAISRVRSTGNSETILVRGESGSGKSACVTSTLNALEKNDRVLYGIGKYDQIKGGRPYSAIDKVISDICTSLTPQTIGQIKSHFDEEDILLLGRVLPSLSIMLESANEHDISQTEEDVKLARMPSSNKLSLVDQNSVSSEDINDKTVMRLFRRLLSVVCQEHECIIWFLDDIQWAEAESRMLLASILTNEKQSRLLCILAQRSEEKGGFSLETCFCCTEIQIKSLSLEDTIALMAHAMSMDATDEKMIWFGEWMHSRSGGNAFYIRHCLDFLLSKGLIKQNENAFDWNEADIENQAGTSVRVVEFLSHKAKSLKPEIQISLVIASYLGAEFKWWTLTTLLEDPDFVQLFASRPVSLKSMMNLKTGLEQAVSIGLVEQIGPRKFKFVHDKVQAVAMSMLPQGEKGEKALAQLAVKLLEKVVGKDKQKREKGTSLLYATTKLVLDHGLKTIPAKKIIQLCLTTATVSHKQKVFSQAAFVADSAISFLGETCWTQHYVDCFRLHQVAANSYMRSGNTAMARQRALEIERNAVLDEHRWWSHLIIAETLMAESQYVKAIEACHLRLKQLGINVPLWPSKGRGIYLLFATRSKMAKIELKSLDNLPKLNDEKMKIVMKLLDLTVDARYMINDENGVLHSALILVDLMLKYGICNAGLKGFNGYGLAAYVLGDMKATVDIYDPLRRLVQGDNAALASTAATFNMFLHPLSQNVNDMCNLTMGAFRASARLGLPFREIQNLRCHVCWVPLLKPMEEVFQTGEFFLDYLKDYGIGDTKFDNSGPWLQMGETLLGLTDNPIILKGRFLDFDEVIREAPSDKKLRFLLCQTVRAQTLLSLVMNQHSQVLMYDKKYASAKVEAGPTVSKVNDYFHCSLACYGLAHQFHKDKRRYIKKAKKFTKHLEWHASEGSPAYSAMVMALEAEELALSGKAELALEIYQKAIELFQQQSLVLHKAILLERIGNYLDPSYLVRAYETYNELGAKAKVQLMEDSYQSLKKANTAMECYPNKETAPNDPLAFPATIP